MHSIRETKDCRQGREPLNINLGPFSINYGQTNTKQFTLSSLRFLINGTVNSVPVPLNRGFSIMKTIKIKFIMMPWCASYR